MGLAGRLGLFEKLVDKTADVPGREALASALVRRAAEQEDLSPYFSSPMAIKRIGLLQQALQPDRLTSLLDWLASTHGLLLRVAQLPFDAARARLFLLCLQTDSGKQDSAYHQFLLDGLSAVDRATWDSQLASEADVLQIVFVLHDLKQLRPLGLNFQDALRSHAKKLVDGAIGAPKRPGWDSLLDFLATDRRPVFLSNLHDELLRTDKPVGQVLKLYGTALADERGLWTERADETLRQLFRTIVDRQQADELKWVARVLERDREFVGACRTGSRSDFVERLDRLRAGEKVREDVRQLAAEIRAYFAE